MKEYHVLRGYICLGLGNKNKLTFNFNNIFLVLSPVNVKEIV